MLSYNRKQKGIFTHASQGSGGWGKENQPQIPSYTSSSGDQRDVSRSILQNPFFIFLKGGLDTPCTGQTGFLALYAGITLVVLKEPYVVLGKCFPHALWLLSLLMPHACRGDFPKSI